MTCDQFPANGPKKPQSLTEVASSPLPKSPVNQRRNAVPQMISRSPRVRSGKFVFSDAKRLLQLLQHGVIPGSSQTKARESALQERMRPASCGLATMESGNGVLCRTGRVVEANIDLRGGPVGIDRARGRRRFRP